MQRHLGSGEPLFSSGDTFTALYTVHGGFFKTSMLDTEGREQVAGFSMAGELLGLDGMGSGRYRLSAVALEDSMACVIPYALIEERAREVPALQRELHRAMSREIVREQRQMLLLGCLHAEERVAVFLLNLSARLGERGYSACEFRLRMTREDIGSYLGLTLETVSRLLSRLQECGIIEVQKKHVKLVDLPRLQRIAGGAAFGR